MLLKSRATSDSHDGLREERGWTDVAAQVESWCSAVVLLCSASDADASHFRVWQTHRVASPALRAALLRDGPNAGSLLQWIDESCAALAANLDVPSAYTFSPSTTAKHVDTWQAHLRGEKTVCLNELLEQCTALRDAHASVLDDFRKCQLMCDGDHSSYSDYSQSDTTSTDDDGDDDGDDDDGDDDGDDDDGGDGNDGDGVRTTATAASGASDGKLSKPVRYFRRRRH
jgi:hypothetical protein